MVGRRGYTLVELLMVVAIVTTLASIGAAILIQIVRFTRLSQVRAEIQMPAG